MKLHRIELNNFRQFKGTQTIEFSSSSTKNVSVVYGENGRGKTGIFRALMFCLYGDRSLSQDELSGEKKREGLILVNEVLLKESKGCQTASKIDPLSASNFDPPKVKKNITFCSLISSFHYPFLLCHNDV